MQTAIIPFCRDCGGGADHFTESHFRFDPSHPTTERELRRIASLLSDGWRRALYELSMRDGISLPHSRWRVPYDVMRNELGFWSDDRITVQRVAMEYAYGKDWFLWQ
jgi:hypothetical protein